MEIIRSIFDSAKIIRYQSRKDDRGALSVIFDEEKLEKSGIKFQIKETRIYAIPEKGTFYGIHYRDPDDPMARILTITRGSGNDYLIDLRKDSPTYCKWEKIVLTADDQLAVYIPAGIGHAFQSLEDNTTMIYMTELNGTAARCMQINYKDPNIGLELSLPVSRISEYDRNAPML